MDPDNVERLLGIIDLLDQFKARMTQVTRRRSSVSSGWMKLRTLGSNLGKQESQTSIEHQSSKSRQSRELSELVGFGSKELERLPTVGVVSRLATLTTMMSRGRSVAFMAGPFRGSEKRRKSIGATRYKEAAFEAQRSVHFFGSSDSNSKEAELLQRRPSAFQLQKSLSRAFMNRAFSGGAGKGVLGSFYHTQLSRCRSISGFALDENEAEDEEEEDEKEKQEQEGSREGRYDSVSFERKKVYANEEPNLRARGAFLTYKLGTGLSDPEDLECSSVSATPRHIDNMASGTLENSTGSFRKDVSNSCLLSPRCESIGVLPPSGGPLVEHTLSWSARGGQLPSPRGILSYSRDVVSSQSGERIQGSSLHLDTGSKCETDDIGPRRRGTVMFAEVGRDTTPERRFQGAATHSSKEDTDDQRPSVFSPLASSPSIPSPFSPRDLSYVPPGTSRSNIRRQSSVRFKEGRRRSWRYSSSSSSSSRSSSYVSRSEFPGSLLENNSSRESEEDLLQGGVNQAEDIIETLGEDAVFHMAATSPDILQQLFDRIATYIKDDLGHMLDALQETMQSQASKLEQVTEQRENALKRTEHQESEIQDLTQEVERLNRLQTEHVQTEKALRRKVEQLETVANQLPLVEAQMEFHRVQTMKLKSFHEQNAQRMRRALIEKDALLEQTWSGTSGADAIRKRQTTQPMSFRDAHLLPSPRKLDSMVTPEPLPLSDFSSQARTAIPLRPVVVETSPRSGVLQRPVFALDREAGRLLVERLQLRIEDLTAVLWKLSSTQLPGIDAQEISALKAKLKETQNEIDNLWCRLQKEVDQKNDLLETGQNIQMECEEKLAQYEAEKTLLLTKTEQLYQALVTCVERQRLATLEGTAVDVPPTEDDESGTKEFQFFRQALILLTENGHVVDEIRRLCTRATSEDTEVAQITKRYTVQFAETLAAHLESLRDPKLIFDQATQDLWRHHLLAVMKLEFYAISGLQPFIHQTLQSNAVFRTRVPLQRSIASFTVIREGKGTRFTALSRDAPVTITSLLADPMRDVLPQSEGLQDREEHFHRLLDELEKTRGQLNDSSRLLEEKTAEANKYSKEAADLHDVLVKDQASLTSLLHSLQSNFDHLKNTLGQKEEQQASLFAQCAELREKLQAAETTLETHSIRETRYMALQKRLVEMKNQLAELQSTAVHVADSETELSVLRHQIARFTEGKNWVLTHLKRLTHILEAVESSYTDNADTMPLSSLIPLQEQVLGSDNAVDLSDISNDKGWDPEVHQRCRALEQRLWEFLKAYLHEEKVKEQNLRVMTRHHAVMQQKISDLTALLVQYYPKYKQYSAGEGVSASDSSCMRCGKDLWWCPSLLGVCYMTNNQSLQSDRHQCADSTLESLISLDPEESIPINGATAAGPPFYQQEEQKKSLSHFLQPVDDQPPQSPVSFAIDSSRTHRSSLTYRKDAYMRMPDLASERQTIPSRQLPPLYGTNGSNARRFEYSGLGTLRLASPVRATLRGSGCPPLSSALRVSFAEGTSPYRPNLPSEENYRLATAWHAQQHHPVVRQTLGPRYV